MLVFRDVSERRHTEIKLAQSEERLRLVMDAMPQKIYTATVNGELDYFNPIWTEYTGLSFEQIEGLGSEAVHPSRRHGRDRRCLAPFHRDR